MVKSQGAHASKWMRFLAVLLAFTFVAAACGGSDSDSSAEDVASGDTTTEDVADEPAVEEPAVEEPGQTEEIVETIEEEPEESGPVKGGTLRFAVDSEVDGLNPTTSAFGPSGFMIAGAAIEPLASKAADGTIVPFLAESFTPSDDFLNWQIKLRPDMTFTDGTPLNAAALVDNFTRQLGDLLVGLAVNPFFAGVEEKVTIIDDLTAEFHLGIPNAHFPSTLTGQIGHVASPAWLAAADEDPTLNQAPVGTGPFLFDSRTPDSLTRFVRNDNYWNGEVYLDALEFAPVTDSETRVDLLFEGDVQGLHTTNPATVVEMSEDDSIEMVLNDTTEESFAMINTQNAPFDDVRVREALTLSTFRENYIELTGGGIIRGANQMFAPESPYFNPDVVQVTDDSAAALPLVAEYCAELPENCNDGRIDFAFAYSGPSVVQDRIADILTVGWTEGGFNVTHNVIPQDDFITSVAFGQYQVNTWRQFGATDPVSDNVWLWCAGVGGISLNWPRFCDEGRDVLLLEAMASTDEGRRAEIYQELVARIHDDYTYIFFTRTLWAIAFTDAVNGHCDRVSPEGVPLACTINGRSSFDTTWISE
jgi:peptide/nickel transport system substrate-binding protein